MLEAKDFFNFLRKERALVKFVANTYQNTKPTLKDRERLERETQEFIDDSGKDAIDNLVYGAFGWEDSPEGHTFWSELNKEWLKIAKYYSDPEDEEWDDEEEWDDNESEEEV